MKSYIPGIIAVTTLSICGLSGPKASAQTVVSSLAELKPYLDDSNVDIVMTPGTYRITPSDCGSIRGAKTIVIGT